jgi:hypothetical protein
MQHLYCHVVIIGFYTESPFIISVSVGEISIASCEIGIVNIAVLRPLVSVYCSEPFD